MAVVDLSPQASTSQAATIFQVSRLLYTSGGALNASIATLTAGASDNNNSVYRMFLALNPNIIPLAIMVANAANTAGTSYSVGIYASAGGVAVLPAVFAAVMDLSSAHASLNPKTALDGLYSLAIDVVGKRLFEHAGHTVANQLGAYDIAITANTAGSGGGKMSMLMLWAQG